MWTKRLSDAGFQTPGKAWRVLEADVIERVKFGISKGGFTREDIAGTSDHFGDERLWILVQAWPEFKAHIESLGWCIMGEPREGPFQVLLSVPE